MYQYPKLIEETERRSKKPPVSSIAYIDDVKNNKGAQKEYSRMYKWLKNNYPELLL
jgi:hypothetical protein